MESTNQENVVPIIIPPPHKKLNVKLIIAVALIAVVIGIGYVVYSQSQHLPQTINQATNQEERSDWKVYHNNVLGVEFSYPESWGDPYTSPDYLTDLNSAFSNYGGNPHFIEIRFKTVPYSIYITLFDNTVPGDSRGLNSQIINWGYYEDNIADLRKSGNICDYHISYDHGWLDVVTELYNKCDNGIKKTFIERTQHFSLNNTPQTLYSYNLDQFTYRQAGNSLFPNVLIKFHYNAVSQQKTPTNYEQFLKDNSVPNDFYKVDDSDFQIFVKSFKSVKTSEHSKTKVDIILSDTADIKVVKTYYNLLATKDYHTAFSSFINQSESEQEFILPQKDIYDQVIKEVNQIDNNTVEVFSDIQLHNQPPKNYREVFKVTGNKLQKTLKESINGKISVFGNMRTYASERGEQSILVLQKDGQERIIDSKQHESKADWWSKFYSPYFSPTGKYIVYSITYYEGGTSNVYDVINDKIFKDITEGEFNPEETLYFTCQFSEAYGPIEALIYTVPEFSIKTDLLKLHPELSKYWNYKCSNDEKSHIETFVFSGSYENNTYSTTTKEVYRFNSQTGEPLP